MKTTAEQIFFIHVNMAIGIQEMQEESCSSTAVKETSEHEESTYMQKYRAVALVFILFCQERMF